MNKLINRSLRVPFLWSEYFFTVHKSCLKFNLRKNYYKSTKQSNKKKTYSIQEISNLKEKAIDVAILGGGILGSALHYLLNKHTDIRKVILFEEKNTVYSKRIFQVDQTIHTGEIESNFDLNKSIKLRKLANMLINCVVNLPDDLFEKCIHKKNKILIGIGENECNLIEKRYEDFKYFNSNIKLISKRKIGILEPYLIFNDKLNNYSESQINGILIENEYSCINYNLLSQILMKIVEENTKDNKNKMNKFIRTKINNIERVSSNQEIYYKISTDSGIYYSKFVILNDIENSINIAQKLGYCLDWGFLNLFGKYYYTDYPLLNGIVYTMQNSKSLFETIYGAPDIELNNRTRFGSIYLPLSENKYNSLFEFLKIFDLNIELITTYLNFQKNRNILEDNIQNIMLEIPFLRRSVFAKKCKKMIPSINSNELKCNNGFDVNIRQLIDINEKKLIFEKDKVNTDENLIINIGQSISGTTCIGNASDDMITICHKLGVNMNENSFKKKILNQ